VQAKTWSVDLGASFFWLVRLRRTGDYGGACMYRQTRPRRL
jgi:hypothetical protein